LTIHFDGFEQFKDESLDDAFVRAGYDPAGMWAVVAGRGPSGSAAISASQAALTREFPWNSGKFSVGFCHRFTQRGSVAWLNIGQTRVLLRLDPANGSPYINDSVGNALPTTSRWYYYELEIDRATGRVYLYINNRLDCSYDLGYVPSEQAVIVNLGYMDPKFYSDVVPPPADNAVKTYDDFYANDGPRMTPITVTTRFPTFDKNVQWFAAEASKTHSEALSMQPTQPLDLYVASDVIGAEDRFTSWKPLNNANPVLATGVIVMARRSPEFIAQLGVFVGGQVGAELRQGVRVVPTDWATQYVCFDKNINDTVAGITAADFGINVSPI
jgi:hypothetical protein